MDVARSTKITPCLARGWFVVLAKGKARAWQSDAGVALAAGGNSDMCTASAHGHTYTGHRKIEMHTRQQFCAALKTEAHLLFMSAQTRDLRNRRHRDRLRSPESALLIVFLIDRAKFVPSHRSGLKKQQVNSPPIRLRPHQAEVGF